MGWAVQGVSTGRPDMWDLVEGRDHPRITPVVPCHAGDECPSRLGQGGDQRPLQGGQQGPAGASMAFAPPGVVRRERQELSRSRVWACGNSSVGGNDGHLVSAVACQGGDVERGGVGPACPRDRPPAAILWRGCRRTRRLVALFGGAHAVLSGGLRYAYVPVCCRAAVPSPVNWLWPCPSPNMRPYASILANAAARCS